MKTTMAIVALLGMTLTQHLATPTAAMEQTCDPPRLRLEGSGDIEEDILAGDVFPSGYVRPGECNQGSSNGGGGGSPIPPLPNIPCYNQPCSFDRIKIVMLDNLREITDEAAEAAVDQTPPLAYVGTVKVQVLDFNFTTMGVGQNDPCEAYAPLALIATCTLNTVVPPTPLYAYDASLTSVDLPKTCLKSARLSVDANGDRVEDYSSPMYMIGAC